MEEANWRNVRKDFGLFRALLTFYYFVICVNVIKFIAWRISHTHTHTASRRNGYIITIPSFTSFTLYRWPNEQYISSILQHLMPVLNLIKCILGVRTRTHSAAVNVASAAKWDGVRPSDKKNARDIILQIKRKGFQAIFGFVFSF